MKREKAELPAKLLKHHPNNPRKNLGDLEELRKSIAANGLLQELTVIPVNAAGKNTTIENATDYYVLIGNRRFEAGKDILDTFPCNIIEGLTDREQLSIMLEENMQRSDLTIIEQAEGFQMMLDLGESVEGIVEKTGFSSTTVYHRLSIAKLDKKTLQKKYEDNDFQLSITDLYELERLKDHKERNQILKEARNSREIKRLVDEYINKKECIEKGKQIIKLLKEYGILEMPKSLSDCSRYWGHYDVVRQYELPESKVPSKITGLKKDTPEKHVYYRVCSYYSGEPYRIEVYVQKSKNNETEKTEYEKRLDRIKAAEKAVNDKEREVKSRMRLLITQILKKKVTIKKDCDELSLCKELWENLCTNYCYMNQEELIYSWTTKQHPEGEERKQFTDLWQEANPSVTDQLLIANIVSSMKNGIVSWEHKINQNADKYLKCFRILSEYYEYHVLDEYISFMQGKGKLWDKLSETIKKE